MEQDKLLPEEMYLRDVFAAYSLIAIGTWMPSDRFGNRIADSLMDRAALDARAKWAYAQADAMMAERNK